MRCLADHSAEDARKVRLVTHAAGQGNLAQIGRSRQHERLRKLDALAHDVDMWTNAERDPE
jgi:hypothetical protein